MSTASTAVARRDEMSTTALAIRPGQEMWNDKQRAALAVLGIKDATNADLAVFMHYCQKTGLDPFSRQIYMIMRRVKEGDQWVAKQTIQVGIDGFRVIRDRVAARTGSTVEYEDTIWYDSSGQETGVWLHSEPPAACKVTVIRDGRRFPGVVRTAAYAATNKQGEMTSQWRTQPDHMIEKCAEAFALRRAFPHDLGGIYVEEEIPAGEPAPPAVQRATAASVVRQREPSQRQRQEPAGGPDPTRAASAGASEPTGGPASGQTAPSGERGPARAASGQVGMIHSAFERLGYEDHEREERLILTAILAGYDDDLETSSHLSEDQARRALGRLKDISDRPALHAAVRRIKMQRDAQEHGEASDGE